MPLRNLCLLPSFVVVITNGARVDDDVDPNFRLSPAAKAADHRVQLFQEEMDQKVREASAMAFKTSTEGVKNAHMQVRLDAHLAEQASQDVIVKNLERVRKNVNEDVAAIVAKTNEAGATANQKLYDAKVKSELSVKENQQKIDKDIALATSRGDQLIDSAEKQKASAVEKAKKVAEEEMFHTLSSTQAYDDQRVQKSAAMAVSMVEHAQADGSLKVSTAEQEKADGFRQDVEALSNNVRAAKLAVEQAEVREVHDTSILRSHAESEVEKIKSSSKKEYDEKTHEMEALAYQRLKTADANCHKAEAREKAQVEKTTQTAQDNSNRVIRDAQEKADTKQKDLQRMTDNLHHKAVTDATAIAQKLSKAEDAIDANKKKVVEGAEQLLKTADAKQMPEKQNANIRAQMTLQETSRQERNAEEDAAAELRRVQTKAQQTEEAKDEASEKLKKAEADALQHIRFSSESATQRVSRSESAIKLSLQNAMTDAHERIHQAGMIANNHVHSHQMEINSEITAADEALKAKVHRVQEMSDFKIQRSHEGEAKAKSCVEETHADAVHQLSEVQSKAAAGVEEQQESFNTHVQETQDTIDTSLRIIKDIESTPTVDGALPLGCASIGGETSVE